jgi:hypothetical protein
MSLLLYSKIPGTQVKRDANLSNATVQCDPTLLFPQGATQGGVPLNKENLAGKIAVEHDICNLDVNNLTVNGVLKAKGPAEICDIFCPDTFSVRAVNQITMQALGNPTGDRGNIALIAGDDATIDQTPATADECIMLSAASAGTQTQSADSQIMLSVAQGDSTQQGDNCILISAAGTGAQLQQGDNSILLTTNNGAVTQNINGDIALVAQSQVSMEGVVQGIGMGFSDLVATDSLKMTQANGTVAGAQAGIVNGVCGKLNVDGATPVPSGAVESFSLLNNKVTANSVVLVTLDTTQIAAADFLITSTASIVNGGYVVNIANITGGAIDIDQVIIHYLVINPV